MEKTKAYQIPLTEGMLALLGQLGVYYRPEHPWKDKPSYLTVIPHNCGCCADITMGATTQEKVERSGQAHQFEIIKVNLQ